jgi:hypothetical protein
MSYLENWPYSSVPGHSPDSSDVSTEAEETPLLRFVARKLLAIVESCYQSTISENRLRSLNVE